MMRVELSDAHKNLKVIQTPIQRKLSKCGSFGVVFGLFLLIVGLILLFVVLYHPERLYENQQKNLFIMTNTINMTVVNMYLDKRLKAVVLNVDNEKIINKTFINNELKPHCDQLKKNRVSTYISVEPEYSYVINKDLSDISWDGIIINNTYLENNVKQMIATFDDVNEYKIKRNGHFHSILITEFDAIIDRYYFDIGMYIAHSKDLNFINQQLGKELKKGNGIIAFFLKDYDNDMNKVFEIANNLENNFAGNKNFFGYVVVI